MSSRSQKGAHKLLGKRAEQYEPQNPYYEENVNERGKKVRTKRPLPEGLTPKEQKILTKVRRRAYRLDKGFTICGFQFGWTFILGLIPFVRLASASETWTVDSPLIRQSSLEMLFLSSLGTS